jgi:hypothetical protein
MPENPNQPIAISQDEWQEIMNLPIIRDAWGLEDDETLEDFMSMVYGVRFNFHSGSPGYVGELYILQGDTLTGDPPIMLGRQDGKLIVL